MKPLIYLATPYTHPNRAVQVQRFELACQIAGGLLALDHFVFSPIAHSHPISHHSGLGGSWDYWQAYCHEMVRRCDQVWIATISGWKDSIGVAEEAALAVALNKPVLLLNPDTFDRSLYYSQILETVNAIA